MAIPNTSQNRTIVVAGSKEIMSQNREKISLAKAIGARIIREDGWVLLTGGATGIRGIKEPTAVDYWVALGAKEEAERIGINPNDCIRTLHPLTSDHPLHDIGSVEITKRRTPALRRFDLVAQADAIVCIEGLAGLTTILELSLALNKALIPIPCTGGVSRETWDIYETEILERLNLQRDSQDYIMLMQSLSAPEALSDTIMRILKKLLSPLCYVILPSNSPHNFYKNLIIPTLTQLGIQPITFNELITPTSIISTMIDTIRNARLVVADITGNDPDVTFQLGVAEALGKSTVIMCQRDSKTNDVLGTPPLDIRTRKIVTYQVNDTSNLRDELHRSVLQLV